jgi:hypothetical protein
LRAQDGHAFACVEPSAAAKLTLAPLFDNGGLPSRGRGVSISPYGQDIRLTELAEIAQDAGRQTDDDQVLDLARLIHLAASA